ncbi:MAG TPA: GlmU family protein [Ignavibacteriaceae bacterium]|nr:GlmU family protein [Ignavibacteriaceae bacterium]
MQLCIFEGIDYERLEPLIFYRPVYDLVCGMSTLREKILRAYPNTKYSLHCRPYLTQFVKANNPGIDVNKIEDDSCLFINGNILANCNISKLIPLNDNSDKVYLNGDNLVAARVSGERLKALRNNLHELLSQSNFSELPVENVEVENINYMWDLINNNGKEMLADFEFFSSNIKAENRIQGKIFEGVHLIEKDNIIILNGAEIKPGAVLDASKGPIYIDQFATVFPNAVVEGPVYLGESAQIKSCARIYENVSIGKISKVGGEVEDSIILPYSNKQHSGFLGHAYLGSWVNLGADTNCSDLKNNYGNVKVYVNGEIVNSGSQFMGLIMGDHSKTAINTMFNTGTSVGFSCNIFGAGFPGKYIPSFSWGGSDAITTYDLERSIETAKRVMTRRNKIMHDVEEKLFRKVFDITKKERRKRGYPY